MTKADEIVKARLAAQQAMEVARKEKTRKEEMEAWVRHLSEAIPHLLRLLERRDYPDAVLLRVSTPSQRSRFGRKSRWVEIEMAGWLLDDDRWGEGGSTVHLLSDGRLLCGSHPVAVSEINIEYSEEGARYSFNEHLRALRS
jgi:hypothetical protein